MLDHLVLGVADYDRSKAFYLAALAPLGYEVVLEIDGLSCGFGNAGKPEFWVGARERSGPVHVAFTSPDRAGVDAFYKAAHRGRRHRQRQAGPTRAVPPRLLRSVRLRPGRQQRGSRLPRAGVAGPSARPSAASGRANRKPCARRHPSRFSSSTCFTVSTPSAITPSESAPAMAISASTIAPLSRSMPSPSTNERCSAGAPLPYPTWVLGARLRHLAHRIGRHGLERKPRAERLEEEAPGTPQAQESAGASCSDRPTARRASARVMYASMRASFPSRMVKTTATRPPTSCVLP